MFALNARTGRWRASRSSFACERRISSDIFHLLNRERPSAPCTECPVKCSERFQLEPSFEKPVDVVTGRAFESRGAARTCFASQLHSGRGHEHPRSPHASQRARFRECSHAEPLFPRHEDATASLESTPV